MRLEIQPRLPRHIAGRGGLVLALGLATSCAASSPAQDEVEALASGLICGADNRTPVTTLTYPFGAVGNVNGCTGTIIAHNKVMTAAHCIDQLDSPAQVTFMPQYGIVTSGMGPAASTAIRITQGRDYLDTEPYADWALLTFATDFSTQLGANYQQMYRVIPNANAMPFNATLIGYHQDLFANQPGMETCSVDALLSSDNQTLLHTCDVDGGASGGPLYTMSGGTAQLIGVQSGHGIAAPQCSGQNGNRAANGLWYSFAPDNAGGVAMAYAGNGHLVAYATDKEWQYVATRQQRGTDAGAPWTPWDKFDDFSPTGRKLSAVNLADNRQQIFVIDASGQLRTRWQFNVDGAWSGWNPMSTPATVKDVAATGASGVATHLFVLGTDNVVRVSYKTGDSSSAWSAWASLGTVSSSRGLSAVYFSGVHQVFVAGFAGAFTSWGSRGGFTALSAFGTTTGGFTAMGAGHFADGRINVIGISASGLIMTRVRARDGSSWSQWTIIPPANPVRSVAMIEISTANLTNGNELWLATGTDGNVYALTEIPPGKYSQHWARFYK